MLYRSRPAQPFAPPVPGGHDVPDLEQDVRKLLIALGRWVVRKEQEEADRLDLSTLQLNYLRTLINRLQRMD